MNMTKTDTPKDRRDRSAIGRPARNTRAVLAAVLLLSGCTSIPPPQTARDDEDFQRWKQMAEEAAHTAPPAPEFSGMRDFHAPTAEAEGAPDAPRPELPKISVDNFTLTREMDIGVLLRALADSADLNIIIGEQVTGPVLVNLRRETRWDRLFLALIDAHGLHYELEEDLLRVFSREDIERRIAMEQALHEQLQAAETRTRSEPMSVEMIRVHYANAERLADSVRAAMQALVGNQAFAIAAPPSAIVPPASAIDRSRFMIRADVDSGQLVLHAVPSDIERARSLIRGLDQPTYQILIEANIVQASTETARELGLQWGAFQTARDGRLILGTTPRGDLVNSNFPAAFDPADPGFIYGIRRISGSQLLQAQLSALQKDGRLNIVSSPSITTLDQQTAVIESGEERPFVSAVGTGLAAFPQIEFKKAVLRLEVTPHVIDENWVKLVINTKKEEFDDARAVVIEGTLQVPIVTRSALTTLYLADGQTTVIGGLSSETRVNQEAGIPVLKDIPGVGLLFRNSARRTALNDTLIFITPRILPQK